MLTDEHIDEIKELIVQLQELEGDYPGYPRVITPQSQRIRQRLKDIADEAEANRQQGRN